MRQLSWDHSLIKDLIDQGLITVTDARKHPMRNVILKAAGVSGPLAVYILRGRTLPCDIFPTCSDGLMDMVNDERIEGVLSSGVSLPQKGKELIESTKSAEVMTIR